MTPTQTMHQIPHKSLKKKSHYIRIKFDFPGPIEVVFKQPPCEIQGSTPLCFCCQFGRAVFSCENLTLWKQHAPRSDVTDGSSRRVVNCSQLYTLTKASQKKRRKWSAFWQRYISMQTSILTRNTTCHVFWCFRPFRPYFNASQHL